MSPPPEHRHATSLCEAYYYAGELCLLDGRRDEARAFFEHCVETGLAFDPDTSIATPMRRAGSRWFAPPLWRIGPGRAGARTAGGSS